MIPILFVVQYISIERLFHYRDNEQPINFGQRTWIHPSCDYFLAFWIFKTGSLVISYLPIRADVLCYAAVYRVRCSINWERLPASDVHWNIDSQDQEKAHTAE